MRCRFDGRPRGGGEATDQGLCGVWVVYKGENGTCAFVHDFVEVSTAAPPAARAFG